MKISIIIPAFNEDQNIGLLVAFLRMHADTETEIIVVDGGSSDQTSESAKKAGATVVDSPAKGRAAQMNYGASIAVGDVFYFVHADTFPPITFIKDIHNAVAHGFQLGRYRTRFLSSMPLLKINEWVTRFDLFICMGGDQTLFVTRKLFQQVNGFNNDMLIMEEYEFCIRAREKGKYKIMSGAALVSARKYEHNSWLQVLKANHQVVNMYKKGVAQQVIVEHYNKMLHF
jgi:rSAM/selenodomain-associated transferase 2